MQFALCFPLLFTQTQSILPHHLPTDSSRPHKNVFWALILKIPFKFISWQSSRKMAKRQRNCWKAWCLKQKINKSLLWFKSDSPDAGQRTNSHLPLLLLQPSPDDQRISQKDDVWVATFLSNCAGGVGVNNDNYILAVIMFGSRHAICKAVLSLSEYDEIPAFKVVVQMFHIFGITRHLHFTSGKTVPVMSFCILKW